MAAPAPRRMRRPTPPKTRGALAVVVAATVNVRGQSQSMEQLALGACYTLLSPVLRGPLLGARRWRAIAALNTGARDQLLRAECSVP